MVVPSLAAVAASRALVLLGDASAAASAAELGAALLAELPAFDPDTAWVVVGTDSPPRKDAIALAVGRERREPGVSWVREAADLVHLGQAPSRGGLDRALAPRTASEHAAAIMTLFAPQIARLREAKQAYVFGAKRLGSDVGKGLRGLGFSVAGYLDNNPASWGRHADGAPIAGVTEALDRSLPVIIGTTRFPFTLMGQLKAAGFALVTPYPVMTLLDEALFPREIPYIETYEDIAANPAKYLSEYLNYGDDRSRLILDALLLYRLTLDPSCLAGHFEPESEQYFDRDLMHIGPADVFVDAGGFDGATTLNFIRRSGAAAAKVYYFEPDPVLMETSRSALAAHPNVDFNQAGAFSRDGDATFSVTGTTNGSLIGASGAQPEGITISLKRIDDVVTTPPTFIKMDIEGAEPDALLGAREQIAAHAPKLAIAAYHKGSDLWRLAELIRDLNPSYKLGLRHYTEGGLETVIYAYAGRSR